MEWIHDPVTYTTLRIRATPQSHILTMFRTKNVLPLLRKACFFLLLFHASIVQADTIVNVQSNLGNFTLELYEDMAPNAVSHFLANIEARTYQFSMVHEVSNSHITGGLYFYESCSEGPVITPPIPFGEAEQSTLQNTPRTIALVRNPLNPAELSGQWVINLNDNEELYGPDAPVVFGKVTDGFTTVENIADAWRVSMDVSLSVPTVNYEGNLVVSCDIFNRDNVVKVAMQIESVDPPAEEVVNVFNNSSNTLDIKVDASSEGLLGLSLLLQSTEPEVIVQAQPETVVSLPEAIEGMATFNAETGHLTIPELSVDGTVQYTNLVFLLTDPDNLFFTLQSFNTP